MERKKNKIISEDDFKVWENLKKTLDYKIDKKTNNNNNLQKNQTIKARERKKTEKFLIQKQFLYENEFKSNASNFFETNNNRIDKKKLTLLKKGKIKPEKKLDLHGYNSSAAKKKAVEFTKKNYLLGVRLILIITGKGNYKNNSLYDSQNSKGGIIRKSLKLWLYESEMSSNILGVITSHQSHGGEGAYYVYLKNNKHL